MTCGIYLLRFEGTDKVYIGQAKNIEKRYVRHIYTLRVGEASDKMNQAYQQFGEPKLEILLECRLDELYENEAAAIAVYDSVANGFNSIDAQQHTTQVVGDKHGMSKYSNEQIEEAFHLLAACPDLRQREIAERVGISEKAVNLISSGINHTWLKDKFPDEYAIVVAPKKTGPKLTGKFTTLVSPEGQEYLVTNIREASALLGLGVTPIGQLLRGKVKKTRGGWTAK